MTELDYDRIVGGLLDEPRLPTLAARGLPGQTVLPQTRAVLEAARLTADAEMRTLGLDETHGNPLDRVLKPGLAIHPFFQRLRDAISNAPAGTAFDGVVERSTDDWIEGTRVRLRFRPHPDVALPLEIPVGALGELRTYFPDGDNGVGWRVRFDDYGTWWTTEDSLELE